MAKTIGRTLLIVGTLLAFGCERVDPSLTYTLICTKSNRAEIKLKISGSAKGMSVASPFESGISLLFGWERCIKRFQPSGKLKPLEEPFETTLEVFRSGAEVHVYSKDAVVCEAPYGNPLKVFVSVYSPWWKFDSNEPLQTGPVDISRCLGTANQA